MEKPIRELEMKVAFLERSYDELNEVVQGVSRQLDQVRRELADVSGRITQNEDDDSAPIGNSSSSVISCRP